MKSTGEVAGEFRPSCNRGAEIRPPRFARTVAAASEARSRAAIDGGQLPWHLCLREEVDARNAGGRWWRRLLQPLVGRGQPAPRDAGRPPVVPTTSADGAAMLAKPLALQSLDENQGATLASGLAADDQSPRFPGGSDAPRLPPPGNDASHVRALTAGLTTRAAGVLKVAPAGREAPGPAGIGPWAIRLRAGAMRASPPAGARAGRRADGGAAPAGSRGWPRLVATGQPADDPADATVRESECQADGEIRYPLVPIEPRREWLPAAAPAPSRLADALAGRFERQAGPGLDPTTTPNRRSSRAARRLDVRAITRTLAVAGAMAGSFALGLHVDRGVSWIGDDLGRAAPGPYQGRPGKPAPEAPADHASADRGAASANAPAQAAAAGADVDQPATEANRPSGDVLYARGRQLQLKGDLIAAAEACRQAIGRNPDQAAVLYELGYVLQLQGRNEAAIACYRRAIARDPRHPLAHYRLGTLLQRKGNPKAAIGHYAAAAAVQPENPDIYYDWGRSLEAISDTAGAAALYRKTIALDPHHRPGLDARRRLAALATQRGPGAPSSQNHT